MRIVLLFSHNVSLLTWASTGILDREVSIYRRLVEQGVEVVFVTYGDEEDYRWQNVWHGISIVPMFAGQKRSRSNLLLWLHSLVLPYRIRSKVPKPDLIKTNQILGGFVGTQLKMLWRKPFLVRCGYDPYQFALNAKLNRMKSLLLCWYSGFVYRSASRIHVASERDAIFVRQQHHIKKDCTIEVRPNWVDTALFRASVKRKEESLQDRILAIGRVVDQKNFYLMIEAIGLGPYGLDIITDGEGFTSLGDAAKQVDADVRIFTRVSHQELPAIYCCYPIYLITSRFEGHPKTLLEAMACGLGVVGTRVPGIAEVIEDNQTGILVDETPNAVHEAIKLLMSDVDLRDRLGRAAREEIKQKYSLDKAVIQELQTYKILINQSR